MIFETLYASAQQGELLLVEGGFCRYHLRQDGQLTIYEIIATRRGAGGEMLAHLKQVPDATSLFARCPTDLEANKWYEKRGFELEGVETARSGRRVNLWRLRLDKAFCECGAWAWRSAAVDFGWVEVRGNWFCRRCTWKVRGLR